MPEPDSSSSVGPPLVRGLGLWQATSLNVANMVGIGPFITIPAFIAAMYGPHALIAWVIYDARQVKARMKSLEERGVRRRSAGRAA